MTRPASVGGHRLEVLRVWLPGPEPVAFRRTVEPIGPSGYRSTFWRCRVCGVERDRPGEFVEACPGPSGHGEPVVADD